jgi:hypothetical protein
VQLVFLLMAAQAADPGPAAEAPAEAADRPRLLLQSSACPDPGPDGEIVICGRGGSSDRYRIPVIFRDQDEPGRRPGGIGPVSLDDEPYAPCGIFHGQRRCNKAEAALHGYGNGRNPISVVGRIIGEVVED